MSLGLNWGFELGLNNGRTVVLLLLLVISFLAGIYIGIFISETKQYGVTFPRDDTMNMIFIGTDERYVTGGGYGTK